MYPTTDLVHTPPPQLRHGVPSGSCCRGSTWPFFFPLYVAPWEDLGMCTLREPAV